MTYYREPGGKAPSLKVGESMRLPSSPVTFMCRRHVAVQVSVFIIALVFPTMAWGVQRQHSEVSPEIRGMLAMLDSLLEVRDNFVKEKEQRLAKLRAALRKESDPNHKYWLANDLYDEYCAYDSDSAMYYVDEAMKYASQMGREDLVQEMQLNRSYLYSATGIFDEAERSLAQINPDSLSPNLALKYCDRALFLSTHRDQYMEVKYDTKMYSAQMDSLLKVARENINPDHPQYAWLIGWGSLGSEQEAREAIPIVKKKVSSTDYTTRGHAMDAWLLAKLYERAGDKENYLKYLILSAQADVRASNKEIASLEEVTQALYDLGDYEHANSYLNYCIIWANEYKSRVRIGRLADLQRKTLGAIHRSIQHQADMNRAYVAVLAVVLVVLLFAVWHIWRQNRKLRDSRHDLSAANGRLSAQVNELEKMREELKQTNAKLSESYETVRQTARELAEINESKEAYIANIFTICSNYITSQEEFRANLHRLLATRKFEQAVQLVKSPDLSYEEIKQLYANFDKIFLQIYPDFVNDFNTLLREEERITLKNPDKLTTELRIYALVRLGLNDSVKIARFLHCSVQTVYNTRQRTRNKSAVPRDEFAGRVRALGKPTL